MNQKKEKTEFRRKPRDPTLDLEKDFDYLNLGDREYGTAKCFESQSLGLSPNLLRGIHALGLEKPAGIQERAIIPCLEGRDVILQAQSGMGKTAAFCIGSLKQIDLESPFVQILVVAPTRELADQIRDTFFQLGRYMKINAITCIGGVKTKKYAQQLLQSNVHVVVGTLGKLLNLFEGKQLNLEQIKTLIIDESDKMLHGSFSGGMKKLIANISGNAQIILSSATMPSGVLKTARKIMYKPVLFLLDNTELTLEGIKQFYIKVNQEMDKLETIVDLYPIISKYHTIIFASTRAMVKLIRERLLEKDINIPAMVGTDSQGERYQKLNAFRNLTSPVLLASDLIGRGIDIQQVYAVINFDLPDDDVEYIHRVGRCGRYGRKGIAINLVNDEEKAQLDEISALFGTEIQEMPVDVSKHFGII